jgi:general secretion pathway protein D
LAQDTTQVREVDDRISIRFINADIRAVIQALGRYLDKPLLVAEVSPVRVTLETPAPITADLVPPLLKGVVESHNLEFVEDTTFYRIGPVRPESAVGRGRPGAAPRAEGPPLRLFVIRLKHARAADVAASVNQLFGGAGAFAGAAGLSSGTLSDELRRDAARALEPRRAEQEAGRTQERSAALAGPVTIVPDELTNSLLVRASEADFALITEVVEQLDLRPLQVLIQVLIVEVRKDRAFALGVDATLDNVDLDDATTLSGLLVGGGLGAFALRIMRLGSYDLDATLQAAVTRGDAKILSRPVIVASNNREARILVGSQRPFVQVSRSLPTDTPTRDQVVQYRDVGTKLTVLPTINADGYVSLFIRQEVNSATNETQFDAPVIATREAETQVLVRDGQTVVLGGLRERQDDRDGVVPVHHANGAGR